MRLTRITSVDQMTHGAKVLFSFEYDDRTRVTYQGVLWRTKRNPGWCFVCSDCQGLDGGNSAEAKEAGTRYAWSISDGCARASGVIAYLQGSSDIYGLSLRT